jgi:hypothetical protein
MIIHAALWYVTLDQENVYSGDGGDVVSAVKQRAGLIFREIPTMQFLFGSGSQLCSGRSVDDPKVKSLPWHRYGHRGIT